jgi:hypothetical protein
MYYLIYKTTNTINGRYYIGAHSTKNKNDEYLGSGVALNRAIKKYGKEKFTREILYECVSKKEMFEFEEILVNHRDPMSYNLKRGGKGGWDHVDSRGDKNCMRRPEIVKKHVATMRKNGRYTSPKRIERLKQISSSGGRAAAEYKKNNTEYSKKMSEISKKTWRNPSYKDKMKNILSSTFEVVSPEKIVYNTNRLENFCKKHGLTYVSLWNTTRTNKCVKKGKAKGWKCKIIQL